MNIIDEFEYNQVCSFNTDVIESRKSLYDMCFNGNCEGFNIKHSCPPAVGIYEDLKEEFFSYEKGIVVSTIYKLKNNFDYNGMLMAMTDFSKRLVKLKKAFAGAGLDVAVMGSGGCRVCEKRSYPDGAPCRHPDLMVKSISCFGVNVGKLAKDVGAVYNNGEGTMTYFGLVLYKSQQ